MKKPIKPKAGQESVWDYPRPPRLERTAKHILVKVNGWVLAESTQAFRVLETSHPPVYYLPPEAVRTDLLQQQSGKSTFCEWKGRAVYWDLINKHFRIPAIAWSYPEPNRRFSDIRDYLAFYPSKVNAFVDGEGVQAQKGDFYGGWITKDIVGPFKGGPGTWGW